MKRIPAAMTLALGLAFAGSAFAWNGYDSRYDEPRYEWARVVRVDPVVERARVPVSNEYCYDQPVEYYDSSRSNRAGATVAGALIGGALGNLAGKGDGRKAATVAGALVGGAIANNSARRHDGRRYATGYEQRCERRTSWRGSEAVIGYDVTYRYGGRLYHTQMNYNPGSRLRVRVDEDVTPAG